MADIFLSYSREDEARIKDLVSELEAHGWSVFWDRRIPAGETWRNHIGSALQDARCIVVAWSKHSVESPWVIEEADEGRSRKILVPLLLDRVQPPRGFREIQAADISDWHAGQSSERYRSLIDDLERLIGKRSPSRREAQHSDQKISSDSEDSAPIRQPGKPGRWYAAASIVLLIAFAGYFALWTDSTKDGADIGPSNPMQSGDESVIGHRAASWIIVAGSFSRADRRLAEQRQSALTRAGFDAAIIDSDQYPLLTPNLLVVAIGPLESKETADDVLPSVRSMVHDAYIKKAR